jgi:hypothetical protein
VRGDHLVITAVPGATTVDEAGVAWVDVDVRATVEGDLRSSLTGRFAVPFAEAPDPWVLGPDRWHP